MAQPGIPTMMNYHHSEYRAETQNWSVVQDNRGLVYVANLSGILEFDGDSWRLITLPGNNFVTSLGIDSQGIIYAGSLGEFGYLKPDINGFLQYNSLLHLFPAEHRDFSYIWQIESTPEGIFFSNYDNLFRLKDDTVKVWEYRRYSSFFNNDGRILVFNHNNPSELLYLKDDSLVNIPGSELLENYRIRGIYPFDSENLLIYSDNKGFATIPNPFTNKDKKLVAKPLTGQSVSGFLKKNRFTYGKRLKNGHYAFATLKAGTIIMDSTGSAVNILNKNMGLQNETVNFLYEDRDKVLWLALDNGISSANMNLPIQFWNSKSGIKGSVLSIADFEEYIYAATWQGLYKMDKGHNMDDMILSETGYISGKFQSTSNITGITWHLNTLTSGNGDNTGLLVSGSDGLIFIDQNHKSKVIEQGNFYYSLQSKESPEIILAAGSNGLFVFHLSGKNSNSIRKIAEFPDFKYLEPYKMTEDHNLMFWITHRNDGISRIDLSGLSFSDHLSTNDIKNNSELIDIYHFNSKQGLPENIRIEAFNYGNKVLFLSENGVFTTTGNSSFNEDEYFKSISFHVDYLLRKFISVRFIKTCTNNCLWMQIYDKRTREKKVVQLNYDHNKNHFTLNNNRFNFLSGHTIDDIFFDEKNNASWIAADDFIYRYDNDKNLQRINFKCLIRNISVNKKPYFGGKTSKSEKKNKITNRVKSGVSGFSDHQNNMEFKYAVTDYFFPIHTVFSSKLKGLDKDWAPWTNQSSREFTNLDPGNYTFMVRARDAFGNESTLDSFSFQIFKPWHATNLAYLSYFLLATVIILIIVWIVNKQLLRIKYKLEKSIKERTSEIEEKQYQLAEEMKKSDQLLKNILPVQIAEELKNTGNVRPQYYDLATIMFMDFKDFSKISQFINPLKLINELNESFFKFDEIVQKHRLEKIKTIGDAYMCAGGIPEPNLTNPFDAILAAFEILNFLNVAEEKQWLSDVRIGIHSGEIMAGIIGRNKFAYDIWGEAVNTASRMETSGEPGKINISGETYRLVKDFFDCEYRGKLEAKHKNQFEMYFVIRIRKEYSKDAEGTFPNDLFYEKLNEFLSIETKQKSIYTN